MPIHVKCPTCGKGLQAPDALLGKKAKCPTCGAAVTVAAEPEILDAEIIEPDPAPAPLPAAAPSPPPAEANPFDFNAPAPAAPIAAEEGTEARRPCPACGEMIVATAAKCRFCGEVFDPALKKKLAKSADDEMTTGDWVLAIICPGIACIAGIVWLIQGKKKAGKVIGISICATIGWNILKLMLAELGRR